MTGAGVFSNRFVTSTDIDDLVPLARLGRNGGAGLPRFGLGRFPVLADAGRDRCHFEHHLSGLAGGAQLRKLVGLGLLDLGARLRLGSRPRRKAAPNDLARFDPLRETPLSLGLQPLEGRIELVGQCRPFNSFGSGTFSSAACSCLAAKARSRSISIM